MYWGKIGIALAAEYMPAKGPFVTIWTWYGPVFVTDAIAAV